MFTKSDLFQQYKSLNLRPMHYLRKSEFYRLTHPSMSIGQECGHKLYRGWVRDFDSALQFYFNCIIEGESPQAHDFKNWENTWQGWICDGQLDAILCRPIPKDDFVKQITRCLPEESLLDKLPDMTSFVGALQMSDKWNDTAMLAQFEDEFLYAHWHTSA